MKIMNQKATWMPNPITPHEKYRFIEEVSRTCYKSEPKEDIQLSIRFVKNLKKHKHYAMLEHVWEHFRIEGEVYAELRQMLMYNSNDLKYLVVDTYPSYAVVTGSWRTFLELCENEDVKDRFGIYRCVLSRKYPDIFPFDENLNYNPAWLKDIEDISESQVRALCGKSKYWSRHIPLTIKFVTDRGVSHELVRHRPASFAQESTRYCNYKQDGIAVIEPNNLWMNEDCGPHDEWVKDCEAAEVSYLSALEYGAQPQEARCVLPTCVKTEIVVTASLIEYHHIFDLRFRGTTGEPHPQMKALMGVAVDELKEHNYEYIHML